MELRGTTGTHRQAIFSFEDIALLNLNTPTNISSLLTFKAYTTITK